MIAIYGYPHTGWRLLDDTPENRELIAAALKEVGNPDVASTNCDKLDDLLMTAMKPESEIIDCTATVLYVEDW